MIYLEAYVDSISDNRPSEVWVTTIAIDASAITAILHPTEFTPTRVYVGPHVFNVANDPEVVFKKMKRAQKMNKNITFYPPLTEQEKLALDGLNAAMDLAYQTATKAGWYIDPATGKQKDRNFGEVLMLMTSELAEAMEADRKDLMDDKLPDRPGQEVELADDLIRIGDTAHAQGRNVEAAIIAVNRLLGEHTIGDIRFALSLFQLLTEARRRGFDVAGATIAKNRYNAQREDHKLEARAAAGGKKY